MSLWMLPNVCGALGLRVPLNDLAPFVSQIKEDFPFGQPTAKQASFTASASSAPR